MNQPESESESILAPFKRVGSKSRPQYTGKLRLIYPTTHPSEGFWIVRINKITNKIFNFHNLICGRFRLENRCFWYSISKFDCKSFLIKVRFSWKIWKFSQTWFVLVEFRLHEKLEIFGQKWSIFSELRFWKWKLHQYWNPNDLYFMTDKIFYLSFFIFGYSWIFMKCISTKIIRKFLM